MQALFWAKKEDKPALVELTFWWRKQTRQSLLFSVDFQEYSRNSSQEATDFMENILL